MTDALQKQFFGNMSDTTKQSPATETEPFPASDDNIQSPSTPDRFSQATTNDTASKAFRVLTSPGTTQRLCIEVQARLNASFPPEQQEEVAEVIAESLGEQLHERPNVTDEALAYVKALRYCVSIGSELQREIEALQDQAMSALQKALEPVKAHLAPLPSKEDTPASAQHHLLQAEHDTFMASDFTGNEQLDPIPSHDHQFAGVMPI
ncbi:hypothetical protein DOTSEDRAFT_92407 [Dothistroma septosporum NZE10]|uniref:Uncharacterized protein n=1 Tax=Dothistroma septosporum (strain NZE10 / CBS 128990) TaxID=675120 RepID=N1PBP8_DOTSN|nr:hypothetical protein DOTSEDRAFT_92407 [Dothistroma septosporum NZE10]